MKRTLIWIIVGALGLGLLFILPSLFMGGMWGWPFGAGGSWGMGPGFGMSLAPAPGAGVGGGMMHGYGAMGYSPFGWIGMLVGWAIQLGLLALVVLGIVWLARRLNISAN